MRLLSVTGARSLSVAIFRVAYALYLRLSETFEIGDIETWP